VSASDLVILGFGALVALGLVELAIRRTDVGATLVLLVLLLDEALPHIGLAVFVGPFRVSANDLLFVVLIAAGVARLLRLRRVTPPQRLLIFLALLVVLSVFRGLEQFLLTSTINEARALLRIVAAALYFATVEPRLDILDRIGALLLFTALALGLITLARWGANTVGITGGFFGDSDDLRVVPAASALIIAQGALISLPFLGDRKKGLLRFAAPILLVFVVLLQHRSVWVVTAAGVVYLAYRDRELSKRVMTALIVGLVIFTTLLFTVFAEDDEVSEQLSTSAQSTDTFEWRVNGWLALFRDSSPGDPVEWAIGKPYGSGWQRVAASTGQTIEVSPHNFYIESLLRVGIVGLTALLLAYAIALRGPRFTNNAPSGQTGLLTSGMLQVVVGIQLLFYMVYSSNAAQAMLLGLACAVAANSVTAETGPRSAAASPT
jgi:hypothetical protein